VKLKPAGRFYVFHAVASCTLPDINHKPARTLHTLRKHSIFFAMALPAHSGTLSVIQFRNHFSQMVALLGREISSSQGLFLNTGQHKHRINAYTHRTSRPLSRIGTHDPSVQASEDSSCLKSRGHCDLRKQFIH
jgi:hypothetical protein